MNSQNAFLLLLAFSAVAVNAKGAPRQIDPAADIHLSSSDICHAPAEVLDDWDEEMVLDDRDPLDIGKIHVKFSQTFYYDRGFKNHVLYNSDPHSDLAIVGVVQERSGKSLWQWIKDLQNSQAVDSEDYHRIYRGKIMEYVKEKDLVPITAVYKRPYPCSELDDI